MCLMFLSTNHHVPNEALIVSPPLIAVWWCCSGSGIDHRCKDFCIMPLTSPDAHLPGGGAHPLLYASFTPVDASSKVPRIDLHKPKVLYSVGRNPQCDIVLDSQCLGT